MWQEDFATELKTSKPRDRKLIIGKYREITGLSNQHLTG